MMSFLKKIAPSVAVCVSVMALAGSMRPSSTIVYLTIWKEDNLK